MLNSPVIFSGLLVGAMIPYIFAAMTMKAVGNAAAEMVVVVRADFDRNIIEGTNNLKPGYVANSDECIKIATDNSLCQMILPGLLVICTPLICGVLFGPKAVAGLLIGIIISGIQIAISSANSGGAWDNCKKAIKSIFINNKIRRWNSFYRQREISVCEERT